MTPDLGRPCAQYTSNRSHLGRILERPWHPKVGALTESEQQARIRALEADMAQVRSDIAGARERTHALADRLGATDADVVRVETKFDRRWDTLEKSQVDARRDSRSLRTVLIGVGVAAVLSPIGTLLLSLLQGRPR